MPELVVNEEPEESQDLLLYIPWDEHLTNVASFKAPASTGTTALFKFCRRQLLGRMPQ